MDKKVVNQVKENYPERDLSKFIKPKDKEPDRLSHLDGVSLSKPSNDKVIVGGDSALKSYIPPPKQPAD